MGRILTAFRAFFVCLFNGQMAARLQQILDGLPLTAPPPAAAPKALELEPVPVVRQAEIKKPTQSEAITLLASLQREARLVDFLKEDLSGYSDEQVGAAVRAIHQDASKVLDRFFAIQPVLTESEGARVQVAPGFDASRYRLTGKVAGEPPFTGTLQHHGWEATKCELPHFTGSESAAKTVAPAEVEIG